MKAPKCRLCGKEEWRHVCAGAAETVRRVAKPGLPRDVPVTHATDSVTHNAVPVTHIEKPKRSSASERQRQWREAHKDEARAKTRERMAKRRAKPAT